MLVSLFFFPLFLSLLLKINSLLSPEHAFKDCHVRSLPVGNRASTLEVCGSQVSTAERNSLPVSLSPEPIYGECGGC